MIHAGLGESDQALHWLRKAYDELDPGIVFLKIDPTFGSLGADPRFVQLLQDIDLPR